MLAIAASNAPFYSLASAALGPLILMVQMTIVRLSGKNLMVGPNHLCGRSFGPLNRQRPLIVLRSIRICAPALFYARVSQSYPGAADCTLRAGAIARIFSDFPKVRFRPSGTQLARPKRSETRIVTRVSDLGSELPVQAHQDRLASTVAEFAGIGRRCGQAMGEIVDLSLIHI